MPNVHLRCQRLEASRRGKTLRLFCGEEIKGALDTIRQAVLKGSIALRSDQTLHANVVLSKTLTNLVGGHLGARGPCLRAEPRTVASSRNRRNHTKCLTVGRCRAHGWVGERGGVEAFRP